jgi:hypothetical protein
MSGIDGFLIGEEQQKQQQQQRRRRQQQQQQPSQGVTVHIDVLLLIINNMFDVHLSNLSNRHLHTNVTFIMSDFEYTTLTYKIGLAFICICLCLLTIIGNFLVLITFRRMRTVSTTCAFVFFILVDENSTRSNNIISSKSSFFLANNFYLCRQILDVIRFRTVSFEYVELVRCHRWFSDRNNSIKTIVNQLSQCCILLDIR